MHITVLLENTAARDGLEAEHGLSFLIETGDRCIVFDTGASEKTWSNAEKLDKDVSKADTVVISHGHYDHTGGLSALAKIAPAAEIYIRPAAFGDFYHGEKYIGAEKALSRLPRLHYTGEEVRIGDGLYLFSALAGSHPSPASNRELTERTGSGEVPDAFLHEQCLTVRENGKSVLFSGCAHNGVLNILERYRAIFGSDPDVMLSGFHTVRKNGYTDADVREETALAETLSRMQTLFYTGHCTGDEPYERMKKVLGDRLRRFRTGSEIIL